MSIERFPIVKIDRLTSQEMLSLYLQKGIFSNYKALPTKEELLEKAKDDLGIAKLTEEQERSVLSEAKLYRTKNYVIRDYGTNTVGFGLGFLMHDTDEALDAALGRISLYKLGHRLASIILAEGYQQRKYVDVVISKERILEYLGYSPKEKQIYKQIDDVMFSLMALNYFVYEYRTKAFTKLKSRQLGYFIYDVRSEQKHYVLSVNPNFVGSIASVIQNDGTDVKDFNRGYYSYPTALLPATKNYSTPAYLLSNFLIMDSGNSKLNNGIDKIVAYSVPKFMEVMKIESTRANKSKKAFLDALMEVKFIKKTEPSIKELSAMKSSRIMEQVVHVYLPAGVERLDSSIKSNLLGAK